MSENPEIFVGIDISKDTLDIGFQPPGHTGELPHDEQGISEATRRLPEPALCLVVLEATGGLETPLGRCARGRHRASKVQEKSLNSHIAWLDKRIEGIEYRVGSGYGQAPPGVRKTICCGAFREWETQLSRRSSPNCPSWAPWTAKASPHSRALLPNDSGKQRSRRVIWGACRCALCSIHVDRCGYPVQSPLRAFADRLKTAGKPAKVVIVACMRKLLSIMNAMLKSNLPWNPKIA